MGRKGGRKGKVDTHSSQTSEGDSRKEKGDNSFRRKDYPTALVQYSIAIEEAEELDTPDMELLSKLYANRSATYHALRDFTSAIKDADHLISMRPGNPRGYFRRAKALEGM